MDHLTFRLKLLTSIFETYERAVKSLKHGEPSINPPPARLTERHFIEKNPCFW